MHLFPGQIGEVVFTLLVTVLVATGLLIVLAVGRHWRRDKRFRRLDRLREIYGPVIARLLAGKLGYDQAFYVLNAISTPDRLAVLELLCLEKKPSPAALPLIRELCYYLGMVEIWQQRLSQRADAVPFRTLLAHPKTLWLRLTHLGFLERAKSAENLGAIRHQPSWPLLVGALRDPHPDVQQVAERALAAIAEPQSFGPLVRRLHTAVLDPGAGICPRSVKAALSSFPLEQAAQLLPSLQHEHPEIRLLATDIVRQMVRRRTRHEPGLVLGPEDLGPELFDLFLTTLCFDESSEVRARAVSVIAQLQGPAATAALFTLLNDEQWFVRIHAVRAMARHPCLFQLTETDRCLSDPHWLVRQTTAKTLCLLGAPGLTEIFEHFLRTQDRSVRDQIAEELQRAGLIPIALRRYDSHALGREARLLEQLVEQLVQMGKTRYLMEVLANGCSENLQRNFVQDFAHLGDPEFQAKLRMLIGSRIPAGKGKNDGLERNPQAA